jgi:glycosyltransferase involved in cell wall biosynthesis
MHIGVLTHNYPRFPGDFSGNFVQSLCRELVRQDQRVTVIAPWDPAYIDDPREPGIDFRLYRYAPLATWHRMGYMRTMEADVAMRRETYFLAPMLFASGWRAIDRWARRSKPDVLHAHWLLPNGFLAALVSRRYDIPLVVSIPGSDALVADQNPLFRWMAQYALRQASLFTANSRSLQDVAVNSLAADPDKFDLVIYGVDPNAMLPSPDGVPELRASLGIPKHTVVLLAVGRMVYKKGFNILLQAARLLEGSDIRIVLIGEGDLWSEWKALGQDLGVSDMLHWIGNVSRDRIASYYNMADILVMPSVNKPATGLSVCVMDAMACAKPIVASDTAGNPLVIRSGVNGYIVPEGNPTALAEALLLLIGDADLRQSMGQASRHLVETEFGWPHVVAHYIQQFRRLTTPS